MRLPLTRLAAFAARHPLPATLRHSASKTRVNALKAGREGYAAAASAAGTERRSSRSVTQKAEPPLRRKEGSGVVTTS
jgi:hypothetical protein